jgi:hypothetical protein
MFFPMSDKRSLSATLRAEGNYCDAGRADGACCRSFGAHRKPYMLSVPYDRWNASGRRGFPCAAGVSSGGSLGTGVFHNFLVRLTTTRNKQASLVEGGHLESMR